MKILINIPIITLPGGVSNHYHGLKPYWSESIYYNSIGKRHERISGIFWLPWDIVKFILKILILRPEIVLLNPSLVRNAIRRDVVFLKISLFFHKKTIVFFHGWDKDYANKLDSKKFAAIFNKTVSILVLAQEFKQKLIQWKISVPIILTSTKIDDRLLLSFDINSRKGEIKTLLFLTRIEIEKGIFITLEIFSILKRLYPFLKLRIVGSGSALNDAKKYVSTNKLIDVVFTGQLSGQALINEFNRADIYIFPSLGEGMPTSVLEAMAFGLPIITRPVGGLADFFENGNMGALVESLKPDDYVYEIKRLLKAPEICKEISYFNHLYALHNFMASDIAGNLEKFFKRFC